MDESGFTTDTLPRLKVSVAQEQVSVGGGVEDAFLFLTLIVFAVCPAADDQGLTRLRKQSPDGH